MSVSLAFSICPNDVYLYSGLLSGAFPHSYEIKTGDIAQLNTLALTKGADILKVSAGLIPSLPDHYEVSAVGGSFGIDSGPKIVVRKGDLVDQPMNTQLIATPGFDTTATFVTRQLYPGVRFAKAGLKEIPSLVRVGTYRYGIVINESMELLDQYNLQIKEDLALAWNKHHGHPLPLGMVVISKDLSPDAQKQFESDVRKSLSWARENHQEAMNLVNEFCPESSREAQQTHIERFTSHALDSFENKKAIDFFLNCVKNPDSRSFL